MQNSYNDNHGKETDNNGITKTKEYKKSKNSEQKRVWTSFEFLEAINNTFSKHSTMFRDIIIKYHEAKNKLN